jgi:hypothetical protein
MGFGLVIGFTEHLLIINTSNYNAIANSQTQHFTMAHTSSSQSAIFIGCRLVAPPTSQMPQLLCSTAPLLAGCVYLTTNSALLRNSLQQWELICLPRLRQGRPSVSTSDGAVSQLLTAEPRLSRLRLMVGQLN